MSSQEEMLNHLPKVYQDSPDFQEACRVEGKVRYRLNLDIEDVLNNGFIDLATWGLPIFEKEFNVPVDLTRTFDQRRSIVKAKKRGSGTLSATHMKSIAQSFQGGSIDVYPVQGQSKLIISFNDVFGTPTNLNDIKKAFQVIVPAHRVLEFQFRYLTIAEAEATTIEQLEALTLDKFVGGA